MNLREKAALCLATGFFIGRAPVAPGTFGSILALPLCAGLARLDFEIQAIGTASFLVLAIWAAGRAEQLLGRKDAPAIVVDEIAGMLIALAGLPFSIFTAAAGFAVFRIMDIFKPFPARLIDSRVRGGVGIVLDDVVAGLYTNLLLRLGWFLVPAG
ncbi:MAG: phosphatidylglycerophosphatase A [Desulfobacterales bacterium]|jgi:phosphatidylglycerophosphatase A|nr:phosphatidylglycerophosphatase A [Desulfobacterales bacterium]